MATERFVLIINPIGAVATERFELQNREMAIELFEQAKSPLLNIEVWLHHVVDGKIFYGGHWHRSEANIEN